MPGLVSDSRLASAAIADILPERRAERRVLVVAVDIGLPRRLEKGANTNDAVSRLKVAVRLLIEEGFREELARWAVEVWGMYFGYTYLWSSARGPETPSDRALSTLQGAHSVVGSLSPSFRTFVVGERIKHIMYGDGVIVQVRSQPGSNAGDAVIVEFGKARTVRFSASALASALTAKS